MRNATALALTIVLLMSCKKDCTKHIEGREEQDGHVLSQENYHPDCSDTANFLHKAIYPNGNIAHSVEIRNNERHGYYESFDVDGQPQLAGTYQEGKRYGLWKIWKDYAYLEKRYENDTLKGEIFERHKDGTMVVGQYDKDQEEGLWKWFNEDSTLVQTSHFQNGEYHGLSTRFYRKGNIASVDMYRADTLQEMVAFYDISGQQTLRNGTGLTYTYFRDGKVKFMGTYRDSKKDGTFKWYYENGQLKKETLFKNGLRSTVISSFDKDGNQRDPGTLKDGNGTWIKYDDEGEVLEVLTFENGRELEQ